MWKLDSMVPRQNVYSRANGKGLLSIQQTPKNMRGKMLNAKILNCKNYDFY